MGVARVGLALQGGLHDLFGIAAGRLRQLLAQRGVGADRRLRLALGALVQRRPEAAAEPGGDRLAADQGAGRGGSARGVGGRAIGLVLVLAREGERVGREVRRVPGEEAAEEATPRERRCSSASSSCA
jgi:hypothetical protein